MLPVFRWLAPSLVVLAACSSPPPEDEVLAAASRSGSSSGFAPSNTPTATGSTADCSAGNAPGCPCTAQAPIACFTGPAELRGKEGCKDGVQECKRNGEFSNWSACEGEVTTCKVEPAPMGLVPDYMQCASLAGSGKRGYGQCKADEVVVIVNDGTAQEMTCCPIGKNVLSAVPAEQHVSRTGLCQADEVATGMTNPNAGVLCTKINTQYLKLSAPKKAEYVTGRVPGVMGQIAAAYNVSDTCICTEGWVVIGGHSSRDNHCEDQCVKLEKK